VIGFRRSAISLIQNESIVAMEKWAQGVCRFGTVLGSNENEK
jgi:hypothetical protein